MPGRYYYNNISSFTAGSRCIPTWKSPAADKRKRSSSQYCNNDITCKIKTDFFQAKCIISLKETFIYAPQSVPVYRA